MLCKRRKAAPVLPPPPPLAPRGDWPPPLDDETLARQDKVFDAQIELAKQRDAADGTRAQAEVQAGTELNAEYFKVDLRGWQGNAGAVARRATSVQTAAAAIVTLYTGLLGVTFSVSDRPLPPRGAVPAVMLGLAIVLATFYVAYLGRAGRDWVEADTASSLPRAAEQRRAVAFLQWMRESALRRAYFLRASVLALGFGVMLLPAPFLSVGQVKVPVLTWTFGSPTPPSGAAAPWPATPTETSDAALQRILYRAQVQEAAERRKAPGPSRSGADGLWFALLAVAIGATLVLAAIGGRGEDDPRAQAEARGARRESARHGELDAGRP